MSQRSARAAILSLTLVVAVAACGGDDSSGGTTSTRADVVTVKDNVFEPTTVSVAVGATVTWKLTGASAHNITFKGFNSKLMKSGTYTHTFYAAGSFDYVCTVHQGMNGTITVSSSGAP